MRDRDIKWLNKYKIPINYIIIGIGYILVVSGALSVYPDLSVLGNLKIAIGLFIMALGFSFLFSNNGDIKTRLIRIEEKIDNLEGRKLSEEKNPLRN
ncbi:MAG: hypothetical protein ABSB80_05275 [Methanoregula sp.]|jgi:sulfite exporter TauE/SafE|uniref:hypothetical protein n=1 Tax=Methanoregula sp. TaxID=2052170 RepID=UPI003D0CC4AD